MFHLICEIIWKAEGWNNRANDSIRWYASLLRFHNRTFQTMLFDVNALRHLQQYAKVTINASLCIRYLHYSERYFLT